MRKKDSFSEEELNNNFLAKRVNLLTKKTESKTLKKVKKITKLIAVFSSAFFLISAVFISFYFWRVSSYAQSLKERKNHARQMISSLEKEEEVFRSLVDKIKGVKKTIESRTSVSNFVHQAYHLFPQAVNLGSLDIKDDGEADASLMVPSLEELENLNHNLKQAIEEKIVIRAQIGGISKEKDSSYKLTIKFKLKSGKN